MSHLTVAIAEEEKERLTTLHRVLSADRGIRVIAEACTASEVVALARLSPRILLVDSKIALSHGLVLPMFRRASPNTRVIVLTGQNSGSALLDALAQGAHGVRNRRLLSAFLIKAIRRVAEGETWVPRRMIPKVMESLKSLPTNDDPAHFRPRGSQLSR